MVGWWKTLITKGTGFVRLYCVEQHHSKKNITTGLVNEMAKSETVLSKGYGCSMTKRNKWKFL